MVKEVQVRDCLTQCGTNPHAIELGGARGDRARYCRAYQDLGGVRLHKYCTRWQRTSTGNSPHGTPISHANVQHRVHQTHARVSVHQWHRHVAHKHAANV